MAENISSFIVDLDKPLDSNSSIVFYLDTNFFINSFTNFKIYRDKYHSYATICNKFMKKIDPTKKENKNILCYTSTFTLNELFWFIMKKDILQVIKNKKIIEKKPPEQHYKDDPSIVHSSFVKLQALKKDLDSFPIYIVEPQRDISAEFLRLITEYDLLPADAYQIATAKSNGIDKIVAVDEDFGRPASNGEFILYTPNCKLLH